MIFATKNWLNFSELTTKTRAVPPEPISLMKVYPWRVNGRLSRETSRTFCSTAIKIWLYRKFGWRKYRLLDGLVMRFGCMLLKNRLEEKMCGWSMGNAFWKRENCANDKGFRIFLQSFWRVRTLNLRCFQSKTVGTIQCVNGPLKKCGSNLGNIRKTCSCWYFNDLYELYGIENMMDCGCTQSHMSVRSVLKVSFNRSTAVIALCWIALTVSSLTHLLSSGRCCESTPWISASYWLLPCPADSWKVVH